MVSLLKSSLSRVVLPVLLATGALAATSAQAGGVQWSVGIQLPAPPVVVYPVPPQRVYMPPAPVYGRPVAPEVVYVMPQRGWHHRHHPHRDWRDDDRWDRGGDDRWREGRRDGYHGH